MNRSKLPLAAAAAMAMSPAAVSATDIEIQVTGPVIELTVSESVGTSPDLAILSASVNAQALTAGQALDENAQRMAAVIAAIEAQGVGERDISTSAISLNPQYEWDELGRRQVFRGYLVRSTVEIRLRDLPRTGRVLDAVVSAGADEVGSISWSMEDPSAAQQAAREAAFTTARERALGYARSAGFADVRLLEVSEGQQGWGGPMPMAMDAAVETRNAIMPIRPGEVSNGITISVKYEMTR